MSVLRLPLPEMEKRKQLKSTKYNWEDVFDVATNHRENLPT
jgi:hypothetical protein